MLSLYQLSLWFMLYCCYGWIGRLGENCYVWLERHLITHKDLDRPLFLPPVFPAVYGLGALAIIIFNQVFHLQDLNTFLIFLVTAGLGATVEYISAAILEKIFGSNIWWNYSNRPLNLKGRICLANSLAFGLGGVLVIDIVQPLLVRLFDGIQPSTLYILCALNLLVILADQVYAYYYNFHHPDTRVAITTAKAKIAHSVKKVKPS